MSAQAHATLDLATLLPGFADPTQDSQTCFRAIMNATAQPGTVARLRSAPIPPAGINKAAGAAILTLADQDTKLWLDQGLRTGEREGWIRFHTGAPFTSVHSEAAFALVADLAAMPDLGAFNQGDAKYPDLATTVIIMVPSLTSGTPVTLKGPGIQTKAQIAPEGLGSQFWEQRADLVAHFQFGIDLLICADDQLVSIPRTTRVSF